jgi:hypothetical protein
VLTHGCCRHPGTLLPLLLLLLLITVAKLLLLLLPKQGFAALAHKHTCCW